MPHTNQEPVALIAAGETLVVAIVGLLTLLNDWGADVSTSVMAVASAATIFFGGLLTRRQVSPAKPDTPAPEPVPTG